MRKQITLLALLLLAGLQVFAQRTVTGRVTTSADNSPLVGVTVQVKGTTTGGITDADGKYSVSVPDDQAVLIFSFIGYEPQEITVGPQTMIDVTLSESVTLVSEIVVTALGIKREAKSIGYAATNVNTDQILHDNNLNMGNALMGKVAGLNVSAPPTGPGGSSKLRIRGQSSFGSDNSPLIVVNGVPINNSSTSTGIGGDFGDGLQSLNPDDIESITVLKGATAAALYGFRAKDGVLMVTTKSGAGKKGLGIELTSGIIFDRAIDFTDFQYVYGQGENGVRPASVTDARSSSSWAFGEKMDGELVWGFDGKQHPYSPVKKRLALYETGITYNNTLSFTGGNENGSFHFSVANNHSDAITPNSSFDKKIIDFGLNYKFGKLTLQTNANYSYEVNKNPPGATQGLGIANTVYTTAVSADLTWLKNLYVDPATGNEWQISRFADRTNPYWTAYKRFENRKRNRIFGNVLLKYDVFDWLYIQGRIGQDYFTTDTESNTPTGTANLGAAASGFNGGYDTGTSSFRETNLDFLISVNKTFGSFGVDAQFGGNLMNSVNKSVGVGVTNFYIRDLYTVSNGQTKNPRQSYSEQQVNSVYGTIYLSYKDFLYLNGTARNDWFSTLNPESNSYLYPSVSASFLFSQAFKNIMPDWFDYGKLRASYAEVGSGTTPYQDKIYYFLNTNAFDGTYAYGGISGNTVPNSSLRPLKVKEAEIGMELMFFDRRISFDFAAYKKNTVDEILDVDISNASGYNSMKVNVGKLRNTGVEALLTVVPVRTNDYSWEVGFNYSYNISEVLKLTGGAEKIDVNSNQMWFNGTISHEVGKPLGSLRARDYRRTEDGRIITTGGYFSADPTLKTFGSIVPKHVGGLLNTFTYKMFRLFIQIDFKAGHKLVSQSNYNFIREGLSKESLVGREGGVVFDGVYDDNPDPAITNYVPNTTAIPAQAFYSNYGTTKVFTPFIYNAGFIKWRTVSLSADLSKYVKNTFVKGLILNASINNVLVLKSHVKNLDPECVSNTSDINGGIEQMGPPTTRSYGLTLNVKF